MIYFWSATLLIGLILQVFVVSRLLPESYRSFPFLLAYVLWSMLSSIAGSAAYFSYELRASYARNYWIGEVCGEFLVFCLVISLTNRMLKESRRVTLRRWLTPAVVGCIAGCLYLTWHPFFGRWMMQFTRDLSFCAVLLNLLLWMELIRARSEDHRLLLISGGLGLEMAGKAIGHSLRQMSKALVLPGDLLIVLSSLVCLFVWWSAFRDYNTPSPNFDPAQPAE